MQPRITSRNLPLLLLKARDRLLSNFRTTFNRFGVTEQQWRILRVLDEFGQLEPREICEMCQILSPSMAGVLARMEEVGLIRRNRLQTDQRRVMVRLAAKGDKLITEIAPLIDARYRELEEAFGKKAFDDLFKILENFIEADEKLPASAKQPPVLEGEVDTPEMAPARRRKSPDVAKKQVNSAKRGNS